MKRLIIVILVLFAVANAYSQSEFGLISGATRTFSRLKYANYDVAGDFNSIEIGGYYKTLISSKYTIESDALYRVNGIGNNYKSYTLALPLLFGQKFSNSNIFFVPEFDIYIGDRPSLLNANFKDNLNVYGVLGFNQKISNRIGVNLRYSNLFYDSYVKSLQISNYKLSSEKYGLGISFNLSKF
jgi:hypothetical protein